MNCRNGVFVNLHPLCVSLAARPMLHEGDSCDEVVQALARREAIPDGTDLCDASLWMNCTGGYQGCPGATHFACSSPTTWRCTRRR